MRKKRKFALLFVAGIVLAVAATGFYLYNKPALNVMDSKAEKVLATDLYATFIKDSSAAKKSFTNKVIEVSGLVSAASENQQHQAVILLKTGMEGASVNCTMEGPVGDVKAGRSVNIKGICNGIGEGDAALGILADVYLVRCYLAK
jgi:hypothetical protein